MLLISNIREFSAGQAAMYRCSLFYKDCVFIVWKNKCEETGMYWMYEKAECAMRHDSAHNLQQVQVSCKNKSKQQQRLKTGMSLIVSLLLQDCCFGSTKTTRSVSRFVSGLSASFLQHSP